MKQPRVLAVLVGAVGVLAMTGGAAAQAPAPPPNDDRANAQPITAVPGEVAGTTVGATREQNEPGSGCGSATATVWYRLVDPPQRRVIIRARALDELDAVVTIYRRARSRLTLVACAVTDERGGAALAFDADAAEYLVAVAQATESAPGRFVLSLSLAERAAQPPGARLPRRGADSTLDTLSDTDDAWWLVMRVGKTYRVNLFAFGWCLRLSLYAPGTRSFSANAPVREQGCSGYLVHTPRPGEGGRYSIRIASSGGPPARQRYRLTAALVGRDDVAPGFALQNRGTRRGSLNGRRIDVIDLYRFDVRNRAEVTLRLLTSASHSFDVVLLSETGRRIACACFSSGNAVVRHRPLAPGRYYAAVRAREGTRGAYRLSLLVRALTSTALFIGGSRTQTAAPGQRVTLEATVSPQPRGGAVRFWVERFVPLEGWHFHRLFRARVRGGVATQAWTPPSEGRWRVRARYVGTRLFSPSQSSTAVLTVRAPV